MIRLETKPKQYCAYSAVELAEIFQSKKSTDVLPSGLQFLIRAGKLYVSGDKLFRKKRDKATGKLITVEVPSESYFVTTQTPGVVHQFNSLEEMKRQFQIINQ